MNTEKLNEVTDVRNVARWVMTNTLPEQVNACANCSACCEWPAITDQPDMPDKAAGKMCEHCTSEGCGIYDRRFDICKGYLCLHAMGVVDTNPLDAKVAWQLQPDMQEGQRPGMLAVMGHCPDWMNAVIMNTQDIVGFLNHPRISAVILRDTKHAVRLDPKGSRIIDVDASDPLRFNLDARTERPAPLTLK